MRQKKFKKKEIEAFKELDSLSKAMGVEITYWGPAGYRFAERPGLFKTRGQLSAYDRFMRIRRSAPRGYFEWKQRFDNLNG